MEVGKETRGGITRKKEEKEKKKWYTANIRTSISRASKHRSMRHSVSPRFLHAPEKWLIEIQKRSLRSFKHPPTLEPDIPYPRSAGSATEARNWLPALNSEHDLTIIKN